MNSCSLSLNARGPVYKKYLKKLENDCLKIWKSGRQLCESISLTGHSCIHELHRVDDETDTNEGDAIKPHNSNIRTIAASNCGFHQGERIDPFELKQANYTFYNDFYTDGKDKRLLKFEFPVFKPSSAIVKCGTTQLSVSNQLTKKDETNTDNELLNLSITNLSQEDLNDEEEALNENDDDVYEDEDAPLQSTVKQQQNARNKETSLFGM